MAAFLDPRFKLRWVRNAEEEAEMVAMATAENMIAEEGVTVAPEPATLDPPPSPPHPPASSTEDDISSPR